MSEKRFIIVKSIENLYAIVDKERRDTEQILLLSLHKEQLSDVANLLNELNEENQELRQQLLYDGDDVCGICKHEYLVPSGDYYTAKCEKGHEECSKEDLKHCKDFKLKGLSE